MLGDKIKELRIKNNLSQAELAKILNVTTGTIGHYEINDRTPGIDIIIKIADYFNVSVDYLLDRISLEYFEVSKKASELGITAQQIDKAIELISSRAS